MYTHKKPEVYIGYPLQLVFTLFFETELLTDPGAHQFVWMDWPASPEIFLP